ncbi:hypothetical protein F5B19DRAFT_122112 [Rostrohypoxylon terebratum]|nr:hypothetical protein F5B19DRAFT_122112 [Rostrohypoxylon terebratum]
MGYHSSRTLNPFPTLIIPHENYAGIVLPGEERTYVTISRFVEDGDLYIYHIRNIDVDGEHCEAQVFQKCHLPIKLYLSRKRRFHRLMRSGNLIEEFEFNDAIVLVSRIPEEGLGRHRNHQLAKEAKRWYGFSEEQFPPLPSPEGRHLEIYSEDLRPDYSHQSYAQAASIQQRIYKSCQVSYSPQTTEDIEQTWYKFSEDQFPSLSSPSDHHLDSNSKIDFRDLSYAKAASTLERTNMHCPVNYLSKRRKTPKSDNRSENRGR